MAKKEKMNTGEQPVSVELNEAGAEKVARTIIGMFDGTPATQAKTMLNGVTIALAMMVRGVKECCSESEPDGVEKLVLSWLAATDPISELNFSKYINLEINPRLRDNVKSRNTDV